MCLLNLQSILKDEIQAPAPHLCIADVAESRLYVLVSSIASTSYNESIIHEALAFFNILINTEEENFLEYQGFADIFIEFVSDISTSGPVMVDVEIEGEMVELLFGVAAKLRLRPEVLPMWFRRNTQDLKSPEEVGRGGFVPKSHKEEFPLFYLLLDYVHHDGKVGDFARTGLLYLIESSVHSEDLEKWVVESDLASLMASGLGALYSQLSRSAVTYPPIHITRLILVENLFCRFQETQFLPSYHSLTIPCLQYLMMPTRQLRWLSRRILRLFFPIWSFGRMFWSTAPQLISSKPCSTIFNFCSYNNCCELTSERVVTAKDY